MALVVAVLAGTGVASRQGGSLTRLLPPPDGQCYFGFTFRTWDTNDPSWGDTRPFAERIQDSIANELAGRTPAFLTVWATWQFPDQGGKPLVPFSSWLRDINTVQTVTGSNSLLYLDWNLTLTTATNGGVTVKDVASGRLDDYIRQYAEEIKSYAKPVLIRLFGGEFNGSWWYGQSPYANGNLTPEDFTNAWRQVVDIFRQVGALNASFVWIPSAIPSANRAGWIDPNLKAYYPGDAYVDWTGADIYDFQPVTDLGATYDFAAGHGKPFFLAEFGVRHRASSLTPVQQRAWIQSMFDYFESHVDIKAISYFNYNGRGGEVDPSRTVYLDGGQVNYQANTNDNDYRLLADSGAGFGSTYASRISNSRYVSAIRTEEVDGKSQSSVPLAAIASLTERGRTVVVRWRGNSTAASFDVGLRQGPAAWSIVRHRFTGRSYTVRGKSGKRYAVRVRAYPRDGAAGPWSATRTFSLP
jgi:hypothetical protein